MLRHGVENKAAMKPSAYISPYTDKPIRREDLEDPEHPGHMRAELFPCPPDVWGAAVFYKLRTSSGKQSWPVARSVDPSHVSVAEAPAALLQAVDQAQAALDACYAKRLQILDRIHAAEVEVRRAASRQDAKTYNSAVAAGMAAEEEQRSLLMEEPPLVKRLADAHRAVKFWQDDERMYRQGLAERPAEPAIF